MKNSYSNSSVVSFSPGLFRFALILTGCTLLLILAGGLVTSHKAGLAVPDWPLSYGQVFPPMVGNIFWEHGHRMIAGTVGILTLIFASAVQIKEKRVWMKKLAWTAFGAVVLQALLGGLTVILMLPTAISAFHATLAQTFFCILISLSYFLSPRFLFRSERTGENYTGIRKLLLITASFIYLQLVLGSTIRHAEGMMPLVIAHIAVAVLVAVHVLLVVLRVQRSLLEDSAVVNVSIGLGICTVLQFFLGIGSFVFTRMLEQGYAPSTGQVLFTALHQTTGAAILGLCVLLNWMVRR